MGSSAVLQDEIGVVLRTRAVKPGGEGEGYGEVAGGDW